jgi:hypothetical protein
MGIVIPLEVRALIWRELAKLHRRVRFESSRALVKQSYSPRKILRVLYTESPLPLRPFSHLGSTHFCGFVMQRLPEAYPVIFTDRNDPGGITFARPEEHDKAFRDVENSIFELFRSGATDNAETVTLGLTGLPFNLRPRGA